MGLTAGRVLAALVSAAWLVVVARFLPLAAFGDLALLLALGAILGIATDMGLTIILAEIVATAPEMGAQALRIVITRRLTAGLLACGGTALAYLAVASDRSPLVPLVFSASIMATAIYTSVNAALRAANRVGPEAANEVVSRIAVLGVGGVWLAHGGGLLAAVIVYAAADMVSAAVLTVMARRQLSGPPTVMDLADRFAFRAVAPLAVFTVLTTVYYKVDVWILALLSNTATVARYAAAYRILDGLLLPAGAIAALVVPRISRLPSADRPRHVYRLTVAAVAVVTPFALVIAFTARPLMSHLFGAAYATGAPALVVLMVSAAPGAAALVFAQGAALEAGSRLAMVTAVTLISNVVFNAVLVPSIGAVGAAWSTLLSQTLLAALLMCTLVGCKGRGPPARRRLRGSVRPMNAYGRSFYEAQKGGSQRSATQVVPRVLEVVHPSSVVDVGCGVGTWLGVFREHGVDDVLGIDGDYVDRSMLQIPEDRFIARDVAMPLDLGRTFDLAVSVEVAEHLPSSSAETFVASLTSLAPVVLFSAAIPGQTGDHHVNLQWPDYWAALFERHAYRPVDAIRPQVWDNDQVDFWYAQNTLLFVDEARLNQNDALETAWRERRPDQLSVVHPRMYEWVLRRTNPYYAVGAALQSAVRSRRAGWQQRLHGHG